MSVSIVRVSLGSTCFKQAGILSSTIVTGKAIHYSSIYLNYMIVEAAHEAEEMTFTSSQSEGLSKAVS